MPDQPPSTPATTPPATTPPATTPPATPETEADAAKEALAEARRQAAEARMRSRELEEETGRLRTAAQAAEDRDKSDVDKERARADRLEKRLQAMEHQQNRHEVAADKKVPVELLSMMRGDDRAALESAADRILAFAQTHATAAVEAAEAARATALLPHRSSVDRGTPITEPLDMDSFIRAGFKR